jgi:hypothetical protein
MSAGQPSRACHAYVRDPCWCASLCLKRTCSNAGVSLCSLQAATPLICLYTMLNLQWWSEVSASKGEASTCSDVIAQRLPFTAIFLFSHMNRLASTAKHSMLSPPPAFAYFLPCRQVWPCLPLTRDGAPSLYAAFGAYFGAEGGPLWWLLQRCFSWLPIAIYWRGTIAMHAAPVNLVKLMVRSLPIPAVDFKWSKELLQAVWGDPFSPDLVRAEHCGSLEQPLLLERTMPWLTIS